MGVPRRSDLTDLRRALVVLRDGQLALTEPRRRDHHRDTEPDDPHDLRRRGITDYPEPADQQDNRARRGERGVRPLSFDTAFYKERNVVERCINKLKQYRPVATRYDKRLYTYQGTVDVPSKRIWLRDPVR